MKKELKNSFILAVLMLFSGFNVVFAQKIYDMEADAFMFDETKSIVFLKYLPNKKIAEINFNDKTDKIIYDTLDYIAENYKIDKNIRLDKYKNTKEIPSNHIFRVDILKEISVSKFMANITNHKFMIRANHPLFYVIYPNGEKEETIFFCFSPNNFMQANYYRNENYREHKREDRKDEKKFYFDVKEQIGMSFIRINKKYMIAGVEDSDENLLIISLKKGLCLLPDRDRCVRTKIQNYKKIIKAYNKGEEFGRSQEDEHTENIEKIIGKVDTTFFIKGKSGVSNAIVAYQKDKCFLLDALYSPVNNKNIRAIYSNYDNLMCPEMLVGNKIRYLTPKNNISKNKLNVKKKHWIYSYCGTVDYYESEIIKNDNETILIEKEMPLGEKDTTKIYNLSKLFKVNELFFLNGKLKCEFSGNSTTFRGLGADLFAETQPNSKKSIIQIRTDSNSITTKKEFVSNIDEIIFTGYWTPIRFRQGKLWGFYPLQTTAKYQNIEPFKRFFARFTLPNGKKGWIDHLGKEYLDK